MAIEEWEARRTTWENKHSRRLDDEDATIALLKMTKGTLRDQIDLNLDLSGGYDALLSYVSRYLQKRRTSPGGYEAMGSKHTPKGGRGDGPGGEGG